MTQETLESYRQRLDELYSLIQTLRPSSSPEKFETFASYFTLDCVVHLKSMNMHHMPGKSSQDAVEDMQEVLKRYHIEAREVLNFALGTDGRTVFCETVQRINVMGEVIEPFYETEVVTFNDDGLIKSMRNYSCWSPIVRIVQDKTGLGPYADGEQWLQFEAHARSAASEKLAKRAKREGVIKNDPSRSDFKADCCE